MQLIQGNSVSWPLPSHASLLLVVLNWYSTSPPFVHPSWTLISQLWSFFFPCVWCGTFFLPANLLPPRPFSLLHSKPSVFAQILSISLSLAPLLFVFLPYSLFYLGASHLHLVLVQKLLLPKAAWQWGTANMDNMRCWVWCNAYPCSEVTRTFTCKEKKKKRIICILWWKVFSCSLWQGHEHSKHNRAPLGCKMLDETAPE